MHNLIDFFICIHSWSAGRSRSNNISISPEASLIPLSSQYHLPRGDLYSDFYHRLVSPVLKVCIKWNAKCKNRMYSFWVWLLSHNITCLRFIHAVVFISGFIFFISEWHSIIWIYHGFYLSILLLMDIKVIHIELFLINPPAVNILVMYFLGKCIHFSKMQRSGIAGAYLCAHSFQVQVEPKYTVYTVKF